MEMDDAFMEGRSGVIYNDCSVFAGLQRIQGEYFGGYRFNEDSGIPQFMLHAKPENASAILERFYVPFETVEVDVPVASLVSHNLANYYHWTTEALSRLAVFAKYLFVEDAYKDMKILVPRDVPWVEESFELFGIDKGRILWYDHTASTGAATGSQMRRYHFSKLFTVQWKQMNSQEQYMNDAWTIYYPPKTTLLWVRDIILSSPALAKWRESRSAASSSSSSVGSCVDGACAGSGSSAESPSTKPVDTDAKTRSASDQNKNSRKNILYVSRQDASVRKVDREEKLLDALRKKYGDDVIQVFVGKGKSMMEQIDMFSRADLVIGPHGAGLANMLFNPRGTTVVMFPLGTCKRFHASLIVPDYYAILIVQRNSFIFAISLRKMQQLEQFELSLELDELINLIDAEPHVDHCFGHLAMALDHELWVVPEIHAFYYGNYAVDSGKIDEVKLIVSKIFEERKKIAAA
jgi:capsular polysaccharide biosynthesis protein